MNEAKSNPINSVMQLSAAGGTIAAAIGYRVLSTIVDLGTPSSSPIVEEDGQGVGNEVAVGSVNAGSILNKDWFWKTGTGGSSPSQYSTLACGFDRESKLPLFTLQEVLQHDMPNDCWIVLYDRVYDITSFLHSHPGGDEVMLEYAGHDATLAFRGVGHSKEAEESLKPYLIGILVENERIWTRFFNMKSDVP